MHHIPQDTSFQNIFERDDNEGTHLTVRPYKSGRISLREGDISPAD